MGLKELTPSQWLAVIEHEFEELRKLRESRDNWRWWLCGLASGLGIEMPDDAETMGDDPEVGWCRWRDKITEAVKSINFEKACASALENRISKAVAIAPLGQLDGSHHRLWVIDQMLRSLLTEGEYIAFTKAWENDNDDEWEQGSPP